MIRDLLQNFFQVPNKYQIQSYNHFFFDNQKQHLN